MKYFCFFFTINWRDTPKVIIYGSVPRRQPSRLTLFVRPHLPTSPLVHSVPYRVSGESKYEVTTNLVLSVPYFEVFRGTSTPSSESSTCPFWNTNVGWFCGGKVTVSLGVKRWVYRLCISSTLVYWFSTHSLGVTFTWTVRDSLMTTDVSTGPQTDIGVLQDSTLVGRSSEYKISLVNSFDCHFERDWLGGFRTVKESI